MFLFSVLLCCVWARKMCDTHTSHYIFSIRGWTHTNKVERQLQKLPKKKTARITYHTREMWQANACNGGKTQQRATQNKIDSEMNLLQIRMDHIIIIIFCRMIVEDKFIFHFVLFSSLNELFSCPALRKFVFCCQWIFKSFVRLLANIAAFSHGVSFCFSFQSFVVFSSWLILNYILMMCVCVVAARYTNFRCSVEKEIKI